MSVGWTYSVGVVERAFSVELALLEVAFVDDAVGELVLADAVFPLVLGGPFIGTARPLCHFL
jgi:hypothetical protein